MLGFIGRLFLGFLAVVVILGIIGLVMRHRKTNAHPDGEKVLPEEVVENVNDLNDSFNRARYMDKDGQ